MPPVFHGKAEADRYGRSCRAFREAIRKEGTGRRRQRREPGVSLLEPGAASPATAPPVRPPSPVAGGAVNPRCRLGLIRRLVHGTSRFVFLEEEVLLGGQAVLEGVMMR